MKISGDLLSKLKKALATIFWYKKELKSFIEQYTNEFIMDEYLTRSSKYEVSNNLIDRLSHIENRPQELENLISELLLISDLSHFDTLENGPSLKKKAENNLNELREAYEKIN